MLCTKERGSPRGEGIFLYLQQLLPQRLPPQQHRMRSRGRMSQRHPIPFPLQQESRSSKRMMLSHPEPQLPKKPFMICTSFHIRIAPTTPYDGGRKVVTGWAGSLGEVFAGEFAGRVGTVPLGRRVMHGVNCDGRSVYGTVTGGRCAVRRMRACVGAYPKPYEPHREIGGMTCAAR